MVVKKAMDSLRDGVTYARHGANDVGARPQMRDLAQKLERVRFRLNRVGVGVLHPAEYLDRAGLHLEGLPLRRRGNDRAGGFDRAAGGQTQNFIRVIGKRVGRHDLNRMEA